MESAAEEEPRAVVFVCDRQGAALGRRERCLKLAGIPFPALSMGMSDDYEIAVEEGAAEPVAT